VFEGLVQKSKSQAFFLSFCLLGGLGCLALVLSIQVPRVGPLEIGSWWYLMTLASPYGGLYYWQKAGEEEEVRVRLVEGSGVQETEVTVQGSKEELERFATVMDYDEKGKVRIRGIFEDKPEAAQAFIAATAAATTSATAATATTATTGATDSTAATDATAATPATDATAATTPQPP